MLGVKSINMFKRLTLVFIISITFTQLYAQYGWTDAVVHLKNGKTLKGEASIPMMSAGINLKKEQLKYRATRKGKKTKYAPEEIDSAIFTIVYKERVNGKRIQKTRVETYIPIFLNEKKTKQGFAEILVEGKLRLVGRTVMVQNAGTWQNTGAPGSAPTYVPGYMGSHNQVMLFREGRKAQVFNQVSLSKSFRKRAMEYFSDCPSLQAKLNNKEYKKEDLQAIVRYYNSNCAK